MLTSKVLPEVAPDVDAPSQAVPTSCDLRSLLNRVKHHEPEGNNKHAYTVQVLRDALALVSRSLTSSYAITVSDGNMCVVTYDNPNWRKGNAATKLAMAFFKSRSA